MTAVADRVLEDVTLEADIPCETTFVNGECPNPAQLVVASHLTPRFFLCRECWDVEEDLFGNCPATGCVESRDAHYRIVEVLS